MKENTTNLFVRIKNVHISGRVPDTTTYLFTTHLMRGAGAGDVNNAQLDELDVAALIINKVFGTGIFTSPVLVLLYTQNRWEAFLLWLLGLIFTWGRYVSYSGQTFGVI